MIPASRPTARVTRDAPLCRPPIFRGVFRADDDGARRVQRGGGHRRRSCRAPSPFPSTRTTSSRSCAGRRATRLPLIPRGSGSSMAGGAIGDGVIVDLSRLARDRRGRRRARARFACGPGALRGEVDRAARAAGLRFPVDPSSGAFCTVGGMASTNAAGAHSHALRRRCAGGSRARLRVRRRLARRGPPRRAAAATSPALERFLADRAPRSSPPSARRRRGIAGVRKDSSGYGARRRTRESRRARRSARRAARARSRSSSGSSSRLAPAAAGDEQRARRVRDARGRGRRRRCARATRAPCACELLDRTFLDVARQRRRAACRCRRRRRRCCSPRSRATSADECARQARARRSRSFARPARRRSRSRSTQPRRRDCGSCATRRARSSARLDPRSSRCSSSRTAACRRSSLPEYVRGVREALDAAGDARRDLRPRGRRAHPRESARRRASRRTGARASTRLLDEVRRARRALGGTLTGEHGDGRLRAPLLPRVWPAAALARFAAVKRAFDPDGHPESRREGRRCRASARSSASSTIPRCRRFRARARARARPRGARARVRALPARPARRRALDDAPLVASRAISLISSLPPLVPPSSRS